MSDSQIKSVALFFLFLFFNEQKALLLTAKTIRLFQKKLKSRDQQLPPDALLIRKAHKVLKKEDLAYDLTLANIGDSFQLPDTVSLEILQNLKKQLSAEEYSTLIWTKILQFNEETISQGLGVSVGTIRHRLNVTLKTLAQIMKEPTSA